MINIAVLGYGTVGSGVVEVINTNYEIICKKAGDEIKIKYVLDLRDFPNDSVNELITHSFDDIINDDDIKIVVEVMGGIEPAYTYVKRALLKGKSVATSNKELVARHGAELIAIAKENNLNFLFEASVGGGIPIIRPMCSSITADKILEITGILNGTTNYILTEMTREGKQFSDVLKTAQELGYAEKNPSADIEGHDACRKIAILSSLAYGATVDYEEVYTEGITNITDVDIEYAKKLNSTIKLVGTSKCYENGISAKVAPCILPEEHPLSMVNDVYNAIFVKGNVLGDTMYYGKGAGKLPTASAVVSDVIDAIKHIGTNIKINWKPDKLELLDIKCVPARVLIRIAGIGEDIEKYVLSVFENSTIIKLDNNKSEFAIITGTETEGIIFDKVKLLKENNTIEIRNVIRMEG